MKIRILVTARDAAAGLHLIEIVRHANASEDFEVLVVTQSPATRYFQHAQLATGHLEVGPARSANGAEAAELLRRARDLVENFRPDAVLCGLSTPFDGGIDEAVLASFEGPAFMMQDFWGEANGFFGRKAGLFFVLDAEAARLTRQRHGVDSIVVGSPRHSAYAHIDLARTRADVRRQLSISPDATVFGFFGQGLHALDGYRRMVVRWAEAVSAQPGAGVAAYRPHPREKAAEAQWTLEVFRKAGLHAVMLDNMDVEPALVASDVICSAFSNCTYDAAYLNYFSPDPLITPMSLFFEADVVEYFRRLLRLDEFPYLKDGLVKLVDDGRLLAAKIAEAVQPDDKRRYWEAAKKLSDPTRAPAMVLDQIRSRCRTTLRTRESGAIHDAG